MAVSISPPRKVKLPLEYVGQTPSSHLPAHKRLSDREDTSSDLVASRGVRTISGSKILQQETWFSCTFLTLAAGISLAVGYVGVKADSAMGYVHCDGGDSGAIMGM